MVLQALTVCRERFGDRGIACVSPLKNVARALAEIGKYVAVLLGFLWLLQLRGLEFLVAMGQLWTDPNLLVVHRDVDVAAGSFNFRVWNAISHQV